MQTEFASILESGRVSTQISGKPRNQKCKWHESNSRLSAEGKLRALNSDQTAASICTRHVTWGLSVPS